jgi:hypothetical protein
MSQVDIKSLSRRENHVKANIIAAIHVDSDENTKRKITTVLKLIYTSGLLEVADILDVNRQFLLRLYFQARNIALACEFHPLQRPSPTHDE